MFIKRIYKPNTDTAAIRNLPLGVVPNGVVSHVKFMAPPPEFNVFSPRVIRKAVAEGWGAWDEKSMVLTINTEGEQVVKYKAVCYPGRWCCHCGEKLEDDDNSVVTGAKARAHVAEKHAGESPPASLKAGRDAPGWRAAGYIMLNEYQCDRVDGEA